MSTTVFASKSKPAPIANSKSIKPFLNVLFKLPRNLFGVGTSANITNPKINAESLDSIANDLKPLVLKKMPTKIMWLKEESKEKKRNKVALSTSDFEHVEAFIINFGGDRPSLLLECDDLNRSAQLKHIPARKRLRMEELENQMFTESDCDEENDSDDFESQTFKRMLEVDQSEHDSENDIPMGFQENQELIQDFEILKDRLSILEKEKQDLSTLLTAKDNEILKLQELVTELKVDNPNFLITDLKDTVAALKIVLQGQKNVFSSAGHSKNLEENATTPNSKKMVYLCKNNPLLKLDSTNLKSALISGKISPNVENRRAMVNKLLDSVYTRAHMAAHTVSGKCSPMSKKMKSTESPKPMLPAEEIQQIAFFVIKFWRAEHNLDIDEQDIKDCIRRKLATEHRRYQLLIQQNSREGDQLVDEDISSAIPTIPSSTE